LSDLGDEQLRELPLARLLKEFLSPRHQPYILSRNHLLLELTPPGGDLWVYYTPEEQQAFREWKESEEERLNELEPGRAEFFRGLDESANRLLGIVPNLEEEERRREMNAKVRFMQQVSLQSRAIECLLDQRVLVVETAAKIVGPYEVKSYWAGAHEAAAAITKPPIVLPGPPRLLDKLEVMIARYKAQQAKGMEATRQKFGLPAESATPAQHEQAEAAQPAEQQDASTNGATLEPVQAAAAQQENEEPTSNGKGDDKRQCPSAEFCDSNFEPALVSCLVDCIELSYDEVNVLLSAIWRHGGSTTALQKRASRGREHVRDEHVNGCPHPRPWKLRERLSDLNAENSLPVPDALAKLRRRDAEVLGLTYS